MQVAETILKQLGGNKFIAMTGSKQFIAGENSLSMKLTRNQTGANYLRITLNSMDLYDMEFISIRGGNMKTKVESKGLYNDMIVREFEQQTGLYTKF